MRCDRCGCETNTHTMSMFNTELICMKCKKIERQHSDYEKAVKADITEIRKGNYNFGGIGKPINL